MSWREISLGEAVKVKHGFAFDGTFFVSSGELMVLTPGNFLERGGFRVRPGKERFYVGDFPSEYTLEADDLIVAMTEQGEGLLGSSAWIPEGGKYLHNQRLGLVKVFEPALLDKRYLYWLFNSPSVRGQIRGSATGTKVRHTAPERIYRVRVSVPPVGVQVRIAQTLDAYDDLIENNQRRIKLLEEAARRLYREWFVALRFPGHERVKVVDGVPQGWKRVTLEQLATLNYGKALKDSVRMPGNIPVYGSSGIVGLHNSALVDGQAIIVGRKGNVGSVFLSDGPFFAIDTVYYIAPEQTSFYLLSLLQTLHFISSDSAVPGLNRNYAYSLPALNPASNVLGIFEKTVQPFFKQIKVLERSNTALKQARDALLPRLMSGALVV